jgi:hypothetical protein
MNRTPLEKEIEKKIGDYAKKRGCLWRKWSSPGHSAVPDRIVIAPNGHVGFLEIKKKGQRPRPLQLHELKLLKDMGCNVGWTDSLEEGKGFIDRLVMKSGLTFSIPPTNLRLSDL